MQKWEINKDDTVGPFFVSHQIKYYRESDFIKKGNYYYLTIKKLKENIKKFKSLSSGKEFYEIFDK